jgi:agmatine deiminase
MDAFNLDLTRRALLVRGAGALAGASVSGGLWAAANASATTPAGQGWYAPADHGAHARTWMAWPARKDIWGNLLRSVRSEVARVARAVADYEPVAMVARPDQAAGAAAACGSGVEIVPLVNDDLWMRDMGPIFLVNDSGDLAGLDLNFNGWGNKQVHHDDAKVAGEVLSLLGVQRFAAPFVSEGGALEVDGDGTVMATESSIINANRNPGKTKAQLTREILACLGARKMLWVPGLKGHDITDDHIDGHDITDDHIDGLARFVKPAKVVVDQSADPNATDVWANSERRALRILRRSTDAFDRPLQCLISRESSTIPSGEDQNTFVNVYVNWYVCNGAVLIPAFGDHDADAAAKALARELYRDRDIVQLRIDTLAAGGGGIHCVTQQQPVPPRARQHSRRPTTEAGGAG